MTRIVNVDLRTIGRSAEAGIRLMDLRTGGRTRSYARLGRPEYALVRSIDQEEAVELGLPETTVAVLAWSATYGDRDRMGMRVLNESDFRRFSPRRSVAETLAAAAGLLSDEPETFDTGHAELGASHEPKRGGVAAFVFASSPEAQDWLAFEEGGEEPTPQGMTRAATEVLGLDAPPALFDDEWPVRWFDHVAMAPAAAEGTKRPTAAETEAILRAIAEGELDEALAPQAR